MGSTDIKSMDLRLGGNPFPTVQQRLQEASTSFSLPIPSPSKLNRPSQPQPYQFPITHSTLAASNITEFDIAANAALQAANQSRTTLSINSSPLKRGISPSVPTAAPQGKLSTPTYPNPFAPSQFQLSTPASYPLAPLSENVDHARVQAEKRNLKTPKRALLQPPAAIQRSFSQPAYNVNKDASPSRGIASGTPDRDAEFEFEPIVDDGTKPPYSYAHLIGMAILRSPHRRLTLNQIYNWIMNTFEYYRAEAQPQTNWQNSIRHNLSLNKAFVKEERPKDEPGKGHYWKIVPGAETQFAKGSKGRRPSSQHKHSIGSATTSLLTSQVQMASAAALAFPTLSEEPLSILPSQEQGSRPRRSSVSSADNNVKRSRRTSQTSNLPMFELEPPKLPNISVAAPRLQESPLLPSMETPPPSQDMKANRKRKSFRDSGFYEDTEGGNTSFDNDAFKVGPVDDEEGIQPFTFTFPELDPSLTAKRPRLDSALSESRIIPKPPPPSFHNLSIISPPPSSSPQRPPSSSRKVIFTTPRSQITRRIQDEPPPTCSPQTRLQLHREDINRFLSSPAKSVVFESSFDDPYLDFENSPAKFPQFQDGSDDVVLRYAYGSPAKRETKRRNYWRRLHSGFDPADIEGEQNDATEVYGVDLGYIYRASLQEGTNEMDKGDDDDDENDTDYQEDERAESETGSSTSDETEGWAPLAEPFELSKGEEEEEEEEENFNELSPP